MLFLLLCQYGGALSQTNLDKSSPLDTANAIVKDVVFPVISPLLSIYFEFIGPAHSWISIHAEGTIFRFDEVSGYLGLHHSIRLSAGATIYPFDGYFLPVSVKYLIIDSDHHLEAGAGATFLVAELDSSSGITRRYPESPIFMNIILGYRYERRRGGFQFRMAYTPFYDFKTGELFFGAGLSFGKAF